MLDKFPVYERDIMMKDKVTKVLNANPDGLKAGEIAKILGMSRSEINSFLYRNRDIYEKDNDYRWTVRAISKENAHIRDTSNVREINRRLREERRKRKQESQSVPEGVELTELEIRQLVIDAVIEALASNGIVRSNVNVEQIVENALYSSSEKITKSPDKAVKRQIKNNCEKSTQTLEDNKHTTVKNKYNAPEMSEWERAIYWCDEWTDAIENMLTGNTVGMTAWEIAAELNADWKRIESYLRGAKDLYKPVGNYRYVIRTSPRVNALPDYYFRKKAKERHTTPLQLKQEVKATQPFIDNPSPVKKVAEGSKVETCRTCKKEFEITVGEIQHYNKLGYNLPTHCKECRRTGIAGIELITATASVGQNSNWGHQPNKFVYGK